MNNRILEVMTTKNLSITEYAKAIGVQPAQISHIKNGRNQPTLDIISKILKKYPNISPDWLIFGNGDMYRDNTQNTDTKEDKPQNKPIQLGMRSLFDDLPDNDTENDRENSIINSTPEINNDEPNSTQTIVENSSSSKIVEEENSLSTSEEKQKIEQNTKQEAQTVEEVKIETKNEEPHHRETPRQSVKKIVILYSDKTYEEFIPNPND